MELKFEDEPLEYYNKYKESLEQLKKEVTCFTDSCLYARLSYEYILELPETNVSERQNMEYEFLTFREFVEKNLVLLQSEIESRTEFLKNLQSRREVVRALRVRNYS